MTDWAAITAEVADALGEEGMAATLTKISNAGGSFYDPVQSSTAYTVSVLQMFQRVRDGSGTMTEKTVRSLLVAADGPVIDEGDKISIGSEEYAITAVRPLAPAGVVLMYEVDLSD